MASLAAAGSTGRTNGSVARALALFATGVVLCVTILVATAGPAAGSTSPGGDDALRPSGPEAAQPAPPVDAREFGVPLVLLAGIGIFLVVSSQARSQGSKMADAPLRPGGTVRFPERKR